MSVTRKIFEGARSSLNSLLDQVAADDTPLTGVERDELDAELARRVEARAQAGSTPAGDNPVARYAGAGEEAAAKRREAAEARERRVRGERTKRREASERAQAKVEEEAFRRVREQARRSASEGSGPRSSSSGGGPRPSSSAGRSAGRSSGYAPPRSSTGGFGRDPKIAKHYKTLDLPYGAGFDEVKASYRKLMRKYHPDLHTQSPQKQKAATELTMQVTQAYNELETYLKK